MKKVVVDLGFGVEKEILVADHATKKDIQAACLSQTGEYFVCVNNSAMNTVEEEY